MELLVTSFVALSVGVAFAPLRWSVIAFLWLSNIDIPDVDAGIGLLNVVKGIILPAYLFWRLRRQAHGHSSSIGVIAWILLIGYVAIAGLWTMFPQAAFKLVGHMTGTLLIYFVFVRAIKGRYVSPNVVVPVVIGVLTLATLHSAFLPEYGDEVGRFSSFVTAQSFASFIAALYCMAISSKTLPKPVQVLLIVSLSGALLLNGSRIWSLCVAIATLLAFILSSLNTWIKIVVVGAVILAAIFLLGRQDSAIYLLAQNSQSNRIASAITAFAQGETSSTGLGTLRFRRAIDTAALDQIQASSIKDLILGHGTCNASNITRSIFGREYAQHADPNRMLHNEWLRVIYEWGLIGLILWITLISSIVVAAIRGLRKNVGEFTRPLCLYLPGFLLALAGENILAGAGNAVNVGFLLLVAGITVPRPALRRRGVLARSADSRAFQHILAHNTRT